MIPVCYKKIFDCDTDMLHDFDADTGEKIWSLALLKSSISIKLATFFNLQLYSPVEPFEFFISPVTMLISLI